MSIPVADLYPIRDLYNAGLYRQALAVAARFGPPPTWQGPAARLLAGRLMIQLGAPEAGHQLHALAFRESPAYPEAVYYQARYRLENFGPLAALAFVHRHTDWADAPPELRADWAMVTALAAARVRDFDRAERLMTEAEALGGARPWFAVERASILETLERSDEALASAKQSLELQPLFRPGVQAVAHLLLKRGADAEAEALLAEASDKLESGVIVAQLATLRYDRGDYHGAAAALDRYEDLSPLMEKEVRSWLAARRADVAYRLGDRERAAESALGVGEPFYTAFAERLARPGPLAEPVKLEFDAAPPEGDSPQTYDLLTRFWGAARLEPAEPDGPPAPDGAPDAFERARFEDAGWATREFTLSGDCLEMALQRGVPAIVTLVEAGFGQPRIAFGYDPVRHSVTVVDHTERRASEAPLATLLERFAASGPRALLAVPPGEAARLDGLELPDADQYDLLYAAQKALRAGEVDAAKAKLAELRESAPGSRLAHFGDLVTARATGHPVLLLEAARALRADFPKDNSLALAEASALRELGRGPERRAVLASVGSGIDAEPLVSQSLAQVMLPHPAEREWAAILLRRSLRTRPTAAPGYYLLASLRWEQARFDEALELYRCAACLDDSEEQFGEAYRKAARALGRGAEAVRLFQRRANRDARPHPTSVLALAQALESQGDDEFARAALDKSVEKAQATRPQVGPDRVAAELLLARAEWKVARRDLTGARADLDAAKPDTPAATWLRAAIKFTRLMPDYTEAALHALELHRLDPADADAMRLHLVGVSETEGRDEARRLLASAVHRRPWNYPLGKLLAEFVYPDGDDEAVAATRRLLGLCPRDAWALRQVAMLRADRKEHDAALDALAESALAEPDHPSYFAVLAHAHRRADRLDDALTALRDSVALYPDHELAIYELAQLTPGAEAKREALDYVAECLRAKPTTGDGFLAWFTQSTELISDPEQLEELLRECQAFHDERPDLWQTGSALGQVLVNAQRAEEALTLAEDAAERFPLIGRVWIDVAMAARATDRPDERVTALEHAVDTSPGWLPPARELAEALDEVERPGEALAELESLAARAPGDPVAQWLVAEKLWSLDRGRDAFDRAKLAVKLDLGTDPRAETAWGAVLGWSDRVEASDEPLELAKTLAEDRAGDPRAWLRFARTIADASRADELLAALDRAIRLDPKNVEAYDLKAERLAALGRADDALRAARPDALMNDLPLVLQGRAAWVEARRGNYNAAIPGMQALVAVDPDYTWGWQQLAEWYNDTGRPEQYLEAASEFLRLRPDHPVPLTLRGEARLQTGEREEGKEDLREALRLHPSYSPAAVILFDACLADDEPREARAALAVLQEHLTGPEVLVKQVQFGAKAHEPAQAKRAFGELARWPGEQPAMFLQIALNEMANHGLTDEATEVLETAWRDPPPPDDEDDGPQFNPWAPLFWLDTPAGSEADDEEKLKAVEATVKAYPGFAPAADRYAELLAEVDRIEEARAVCLSAGDPPPVALRGRLAWVEARAGDRAKAIEMMEQVVADEPDYSWGWRQLTLWFDQLDRPRDCARAADHLVRLNPADPIAHVIRGEARLAHGDARGARDDFERAYEIDADFPAAGLQLAGAQLLTDDLPGAAKTLAALAARSPGPIVTARQVRLAARQGELDAARERLRELLDDRLAPPTLLREAFDDFAGAGWTSEADEELDRAVESGEITPSAAGVWVDRRLAAGKPAEVADRLSDLAKEAPLAAREAATQYAERLAASKDTRGAQATVQRFAELLRGSDESWARVGAVLADLKQYDHAAAWLADYAERPDADAEALVPLLAARLALGDDKLAATVALAGLERAEETEDEPPPECCAWLAVFAANRGEADKAEEFLEDVEPVGQPDTVRLILAMADALVTVQRAADKPRAFAEVKADLKSAADACRPEDVPAGAARWYAKTATRLAADAGTLGAKLWALGQRLRPWVRG